MSVSTLISVFQSLSKEQKYAILVAVLPNSAKGFKRVDGSRNECPELKSDNDDAPDYTIAEMFTEKKRNGKATKAQKYRLVSTDVNTPANYFNYHFTLSRTCERWSQGCKNLEQSPLNVASN